MKIRIHQLIAAAFLTAPTFVSADVVDLVANGSFEKNIQADGTWGIYPSLTGWSGSPDIELRNNVAGTAYDGVNFVELDAYFNSSMSQLLTGDPGLYTLSFWYSARPGTGSTNDLTFTFDGSAPITLLTGVSGSSAHDWQHYTTLVNFDGNGLLTFSATGINDSLGGSLDMVSFTSAIPEPETYAMLLAGLGLLGFSSRTQKNKSV